MHETGQQGAADVSRGVKRTSEVAQPGRVSKQIKQMVGKKKAAVVGVRQEQDSFIVHSILPDSPAQHRGTMKAGDFLVGVNGQTTTNMGLKELVGWLVGPSGIEIKFTFDRKQVSRTPDLLHRCYRVSLLFFVVIT